MTAIDLEKAIKRKKLSFDIYKEAVVRCLKHCAVDDEGEIRVQDPSYTRLMAAAEHEFSEACKELKDLKEVEK